LTARHLHLTGPGRTLIAGAPEGFDARVLSRLVQGQPADGDTAQLVHVARDDARLAKLADAIAFFAPDIEVLLFPAWDCLPYDRVSPHRDIVSQRIDTLTRLLKPAANAARRIVLTTVAALLQRVPTQQFFDGALFPLHVGDTTKPEALVAYLGNNGYTRSETVNEAGEFAVRGGIVDLFPPGTAQPLRVDFFGDDVESIRAFDPLTQRSSDKVAAIDLKPVGEFRLDARAIELFRSRYRERFGTAVADDPLYEAVSAGRLYAGLEHWLPLYHERLGTLLDYAPGAAVTLDYQADESRDARIALIGDFYEARLAYRKAEEAMGAPYRPLPKEMLYLTTSEWDDLLSERAVALLSPFDAPEGAPGVIDAGGRRGRDFADARAQPDLNVFDVLRDHAAALQKAGHRTVIAGYTAGSLDRLSHLLKDHGIDRQHTLPRWSDLSALAADHVGLMALPLDAGFQSGDIAVIAEADIVGDRLARPAKKRKRSDQFLAELANFAEGDYVVHVDHGIGRYDGLATLEVGGAPHDCLRILYDGGDKLFVPVENIEVLSRYSSEDALVQLDKLGGLGWQTRKARVKQRIREIAGQLIKTAAERQVRAGAVVPTPEGVYDEFCARFPMSRPTTRAAPSRRCWTTSPPAVPWTG
jgi:transcription-repair coupling factor (superfamily II helicase)